MTHVPCCAWRIMRVSASSWLHCYSGTCSDVVNCNFQHSSCVVTYNVLSPNFLLNSSFLNCETRNLTISILLQETVNTLLHDFTLYPGRMFCYLTPSVLDVRLALSAFSTDTSGYTSNTPSTRLLLLLDNQALSNITANFRAGTILEFTTIKIKLLQ